MDIFLNLGNFFLDFIFPKSVSVHHLEDLSEKDLINIFPKPRHIENDRVIAIFDYQHQDVRNLVWEIKYKANSKLIARVAAIIYEILCVEIAERALFENFVNPVLIPMPMSKHRKHDRGYNQTELICEAIMQIDKNNLLEYAPHRLSKVRDTESQTKTQTKTARLENLKYSMSVKDAEKFRGRCVVLIDDVYTTGASVAEATRALHEAKVKKILTITVAH